MFPNTINLRFYSPVEPASLIGLLPVTLLFENASFQKPPS